MSTIRIVDEQFKSLPLGYLPTDITAIGEYHYYRPGDTGIWYEPNKDTSWTGRKCWMIKEREGIRELEQGMYVEACTTIPMLVTGEREWRNYELGATVWPLRAAGSDCGIGFRYMDSRHFYWFCLSGGTEAVVYKKEEEDLIVLARASFAYDSDHAYRLGAHVQDQTLTCSIDGRQVLTVVDGSYDYGNVAIAALTEARFSNVTVDMTQPELQDVSARIQAKQDRLLAKRSHYPAPKLWRTLDLHDFGAARSIRYGDLTGDGIKDLLFIQNMESLNSCDECMISCITAVDLDGRVLWQIGEPDPRNGMLTADVPVQIYDIDGDGFNEVIYCKDFKLIIADGRTGKTKASMPTPCKIPHDRFVIYQNVTFDRIVVDSIRICNFSGSARPSDLLIKDRYNNLWAYDNQFNLLWQQYVNAGHFPYSYDMNGDGKDELVAGHTLLSSEGERLWELPGMHCHVDEIVIGRFDPDKDELLIAMSSGEDGFVLADQNGSVLVQDMLGHAQRVSVANYRPELPGLEYCVTTFWRNTGIIALYDCKGNRLWSGETGANGNVITPVNWTGDGKELILYSANARYGGLHDGYGDQVVALPDDGHPDLTCDAVDLCGDEREELLVWDTRRMYIYTQADSPKDVRYVPDKYEAHNYSNYRGEYSFPRWKDRG
ncbi:hypothetical protein GXP70_16295 [Paenibacillus lycopersici]|uniref:Rhamnogalacturonan lyase family 11 C-terminal domain-containing protein n=1 Tax=Paenibacillus lycopersici TaxID=2704462 RepID=A0A6C0FZ55_9BACL|nr:hypothetical protein [Paenibacillus lycopersici]QHT61362.1 hypothetical protein GXP70_16295 [Paenibacillus lycopersici]